MKRVVWLLLKPVIRTKHKRQNKEEKKKVHKSKRRGRKPSILFKGVFDKGKGLWGYCSLGDYCSFFCRFVLGNQPNSSLITVVNYRDTLTLSEIKLPHNSQTMAQKSCIRLVSSEKPGWEKTGERKIKRSPWFCSSALVMG